MDAYAPKNHYIRLIDCGSQENENSPTHRASERASVRTEQFSSNTFTWIRWCRCGCCRAVMLLLLSTMGSCYTVCCILLLLFRFRLVWVYGVSSPTYTNASIHVVQWLSVYLICVNECIHTYVYSRSIQLGSTHSSLAAGEWQENVEPIPTRRRVSLSLSVDGLGYIHPK